MHYPEILDLTSIGQQVRWTEHEAMLYALAVGLGDNPTDPAALPYFNGPDMRAMPTLACVSAYQAGLRHMGIDRSRLLHSAQEMRFLKPMPVSAQLTADSRTLSVHDKGADKGAVIRIETTLRDSAGEPLAVLIPTLFARGDGGFGGQHGEQGATRIMPDREPDLIMEYPVAIDRALLYRLLGDLNPIHSDPVIARKAGFDPPLLHGMCTYGIACRAVVQAFAGNDPGRLRTHAARFAAPFFPGETLQVELWRDGPAISFQARSRERGVLVLTNGWSELDPE